MKIKEANSVMAKGGYRAGAGRPKGTKGIKRARSEDSYPLDVARAAVRDGLSPLEYMLGVMRNQDADQARRDRMAVAAAPFCHQRMADNRIGKKETQDDLAKNAGHDSEWSRDLEFEGSPN